MKKTRKFAVRAAAAAVALVMAATTVITAFADDGTGELDLFVYYSDDITPQEGDTFTVTYEDSDGNSSTLTFDTYEYAEDYGVFELPVGTYTATDVTYEGTNQDIFDQGYGITSQFKVKEGDYTILRIYIGESEVESLQTSYPYFSVIKEGGYDEDDPVVYEDRNGKYIIQEVDGEEVIVYLDDIGDTDEDTSEEEAEAYEGNGETGSSQDTDTGQSSSQEPVTEYYDDDEEDDGEGNSLAITALIIAIVGLGGGAGIFIARKKGII